MNNANKLVVVAGATGKLGRLLIQALLSHPNVRVRALVRDPKKPEAQSLASDKVELHAFDALTADEAARTAAVAGSFAVVSTLQGGPEIIVEAQLALLRAAKAAGARRFIPSDFSYNLFGLAEGVNLNSDWRRKLAELAHAEIDRSFEVVHVLMGIFASREVLGFMGLLDAAGEQLSYWGDGQTPIDWTTWEDTARFTAAAALDERPVPERLFVSGDRMDVLSFAQVWERTHGKPLKLKRLGSVRELEQETARRFATEASNMFAWLPLMYARGVFGGTALLGESDNPRYPDIQAETVEQAMRRGAI
jgi:nucleoside-diphosphate-sugar epimerase